MEISCSIFRYQITMRIIAVFNNIKRDESVNKGIPCLNMAENSCFYFELLIRRGIFYGLECTKQKPSKPIL